MTRRACTILCLSLVGIATEARGQEELVPEAISAPDNPAFEVDAITAVAFGDHLRETGDPFNALTWYRLGLFLDEDRTDAAPIRYRIALAYELGDRYDAATRAWLDVAGEHPELSPEATYRAAMTTLAQHHAQEARLYLDEVRMEGPDTPWAVRAEYMAALAHLDAGSADLAATELRAFAAAHPGSALGLRAQAAAATLDGKVPRRSPAVAGLASTVLPGSGQIYAGHLGDGVLAFLASGTLALSTYALIAHGIETERGWEVGVGGVLGVMATGTWASNVLGAVQGARRTNRHHELRRNEEALREADHADLAQRPEDVVPPPL